MPPKSLEKITINIESQALKEIRELSSRIEERLSIISPKDSLKKQLKDELGSIKKFIFEIENCIDTIEEIFNSF